MLAIAASVIPLLVAVAAVFVLLRAFRGRAGARLADTGSGTRVPLTASFGSKKGFGPFGGSHNNFNPLLILHEDGFEYRVVRKQAARYADVARVDAMTGPLTANVVFEFTNSSFVFTGNTGRRERLAEVLRFLEGKGCKLTDRARAIADASGTP